MTQVNFHMEKVDYDIFKARVGDRNVSATLRNYALSYVEGTDLNEKKLIKQFEMIDNEKKKLDSRHNSLKIRLDKIENVRKLEELKNIDKEKKEREKMEDVEHATSKEQLHRLV